MTDTHGQNLPEVRQKSNGRGLVANDSQPTKLVPEAQVYGGIKTMLLSGYQSDSGDFRITIAESGSRRLESRLSTKDHECLNRIIGKLLKV